MAETAVLTIGELDRLQVMTRIAERRLTRRKAAALLKLSHRRAAARARRRPARNLKITLRDKKRARAAAASP